MTVKTFVQPDYTGDSGSQYPANIDASFGALASVANQFSPHEQSAPDMTVRVEAGKLQVNTTITVVAAQSTATITAPVTNPRIDRIVIDSATGAVSVITGAEAASPAAPAITSGKLAVAQVLLATSTTAITNSMITDERSAVPVLTHTIDLTGGQIKFPSTQNPSSNANTLDDYEEGTFTAQLKFGGNNVGMASTAMDGNYTKIGRLVTFSLGCWLTNKGSSTGAATILMALPTIQEYGCVPIQISNISFVGQVQGVMPNGGSTIYLQQVSEAGVVASLTDANFANNSAINISGHYWAT